MERQAVENVHKQKQGISGSTLKIIAIVTMFIDHIGAAIIEKLPAFYNDSTVFYTDRLLRYIGRIAFPIFCFLLVEGFLHTSDKKKYAIRLFLFALISEVPFDLAFNHKIFELTHQNVFFTLFIGLLTLMAIEYFDNKYIYKIVCMMIGVLIAQFLKTDYAGFGVIFILIMYTYRNHTKYKNIIGSILLVVYSFPWEITGLLAFIPMTMYNGKRGIQMKYFFYLFYPIHLLLLYATWQLILR